MKYWKHWKKIEHWLVILIFAIMVIDGPLILIFSDELGLYQGESDYFPPLPSYDPYGRP